MNRNRFGIDVTVIALLLGLLMGCGSGRGGDGGGAAPDTTAPALSNITANNITDTGGVITWTTDEAATSQVEYGTTA